MKDNLNFSKMGDKLNVSKMEDLNFFKNERQPQSRNLFYDWLSFVRISLYFVNTY
jgi:hypothetical protein